MSDELPPELEDAPPGTISVYRELQLADEPLTYDELVERTGLARSTVRRKTTQLAELGLADPRLELFPRRRAYSSSES
jgi:DNA-binding IclR family transcriptional regulator